jgi:predicted transcriptional regulator
MKDQSKDISRCLMMLRYGTMHSAKERKPVLSQKAIANLLHLSPSTVRNYLTRIMTSPEVPLPIKRGRPRKITKEHADLVTEKEYLISLGG